MVCRSWSAPATIIRMRVRRPGYLSHNFKDEQLSPGVLAQKLGRL